MVQKYKTGRPCGPKDLADMEIIEVLSLQTFLSKLHKRTRSPAPSCAFRDYASLLVRIAGSSGVFPIRLEPVVAIQSGTESGICHVGPVIFVEAGRVFKLAFV